MLKKIKDFWNQIPPHDRKLIRWTALVCYGLLMLSLVVLFYYTAYLVPQPLPTSADSLAQTEADSAQESLVQEDSLIPPPLPTNEALFAGLDSFDNRAHRELAKIYLEKQQFDKSLSHAERIAPWMEEDLEFQGQIGTAFLKAGKPNQAIAHLSKALQLNPKDPELFADLALARFRGVHPDSGIHTIEAAMEKFPNHPMIMTHRAAMLGEVREKGAAGERIFRELVSKHPAYADAHYQFGRFLMNQGNYSSSLKELLTARRLDPFNPRIQARIGMAEFQLGNDQAAEVAYKTALAMNPEDYNTWFNLGELHLSLANESDRPSIFTLRSRLALEAYLASLAHAPDHPDAHYRVGTLLNFNKQNREAILHLQKALNANPRAVPVLLQLAAAWEALGDRAQAWDYVQQAYELDPFNKILISQILRLKKAEEKSPKT